MRVGASGKRVTGGFGVRRGIAVAGVLMVAGAVAYGGAAGAAPQPTLGQVKSQVNSLTARLDGLNQRYDQVAQQLPAAQARLTQVQREAAQDQARFQVARAQVAQLAAVAYENSGQESMAALLASSDPSTILGQGSLLLQLSGSRVAQTRQLLAAARQLAGVQTSLQRTKDGIAALRTQLAAQKNAMSKLLASKQATLDSLTTQQQTVVTSTTIGAGGTTSATYTGPTSTQAGKAVAFAYAQLGKPYQWGATGPGSYDCSGLVQAAWAAAGVSIPRDTYEQWGALPHIASSAIQPGDLLFFDGVGHVAMAVGGGYMIDAPQTGLDVEKIPMNTGWYAATFVGAARP